MPRIVISEFMDDAAVDSLRPHHDVSYDTTLVDDPEKLREACLQADALIVRNRTQVNADLLQASAKLQCVGRLGVGLDNIDMDCCAAHDVTVYPATGANKIAVAEYVISCTLSLTRRSYYSFDQMISGEWPRPALIGNEVAGKTLGLVGFGDIAQGVAARAQVLGMNVIAYDPFVSADAQVWGDVTSCTLNDVLETSDVISLHTPLTDETRLMINADSLTTFKQGSCLINTARGGIVDDAALATSIRTGHLAGAALDVFQTEPLTAESGLLFRDLHNVILTPHIAGVTDESNIAVSQLTADNVMRHLATV